MKYLLHLILTLVISMFLGGTLTAQKQDVYKAPSWSQGIIWYQIFPERFRDGDSTNQPDGSRIQVPENWQVSDWTMDWYSRDEWEMESSPDFYSTVRKRRYGGDIQGIIDQLDYLKELGVGGIYFNPLFDAPSEHKYDAASYHHIDRNFGPDPKADELLFEAEDPGDPSSWKWSSADSLFLKLIEEVHKRDMKIIIDGVWNHTGTDFWAFDHLEKYQEKSPYKDWYIVNAFDDPGTPDTSEFDYEGWWGYKGLPVFNEEDGNLMPGVREHIFAVTRRWMDPNGDGDPSDGIDGWRLDVAEEVGMEWWKEWHELVRDINPEAITVAEIWTDKAKEFIKAGLFTSVMNYRFAMACQDFFIDEEINTQSFLDRLIQIQKDYPESAQHVLQNLMDSHDVPRVASMCVNPGREYDRNAHPRDGFRVRKPSASERKMQRLITLFQFTWPGAPMIYYGTESGMWGAGDPDDRKPMVWDDLNYSVEDQHPYQKPRPADDNNFDRDLFSYYQQLTHLRNEHAALQYGAVEILRAEDGLILFQRSFGEDSLFIMINSSDDLKEIDLSSFLDSPQMEELLTGSRIESRQMIIDGKSGMIFKN